MLEQYIVLRYKHIDVLMNPTLPNLFSYKSLITSDAIMSIKRFVKTLD